MNGSSILITGGSSGIGAAAVAESVNRGLKTFFFGRDASRGAYIEKTEIERGGECKFIPCDITRSESVKHAFRELGSYTTELNFAFNNAGVSAPGALHQIGDEEVKNCLDVNVYGLWTCLAEELDLMYRQGRGVIVNNLSIHALLPVFEGVGIYAASKSAGAMLTKSAALEAAATGIRVNAIASGPVDTPMYRKSIADSPNANKWPELIPNNRIATINEVLEAVFYLLGEGSSYITGHVLPVDGGVSSL